MNMFTQPTFTLAQMSQFQIFQAIIVWVFTSNVQASSLEDLSLKSAHGITI